MDARNPIPDEMTGAAEAWLDFHAAEIVHDMVATYGFAKARDKLAAYLCERSAGRPVIIDHIQEPH